ncbi:MAG TPA: hypothetical protein VHW68_07195 [Actinomycetota bacterium]|nr:hypothetical protein [Actinomycetota bacterium]
MGLGAGDDCVGDCVGVGDGDGDRVGLEVGLGDGDFAGFEHVVFPRHPL